MKLKKQLERFKNWQRQPSEFHITSDEEHKCQCCGYRYKGNFCPCCSQKVGVGEISWKTVRRGVMDIWGLGTRSLPYSLWQLLVRPGYFISEYISGKRQVSFPPVKMLFVVAILFSIIFYWFFPDVLGLQAIPSHNSFDEWTRSNYGWSRLILGLCFLFPTWILFRNAPHHTHLTIPKTFFIIVFMSILEIMIETFVFGAGALFGASEGVIIIIIYFLMALYYYFAYKQIFGHGAWATLWRQIFMWIIGLFLFASITELTECIVSNHQVRIGLLYMLLIAVLFLSMGHILNLWTTRRSMCKAQQAENTD